MDQPRWGEPGLPLLPESLRREFADETLPSWLLTDLDLPQDATTMALDQSVWSHLHRLPERVERFLITLFTYRIPRVNHLRVIEGSWPRGIDLKDFPWPTRIRNALKRSAKLSDPSWVERATYGEVLAIHNLGVKSVLEFAALLEVAIGSGGEPLDEDAREGLMLAAEEDWAEKVRSDDPRFRDVVPALSGSLAQLLEEAINNPEGPRAAALVEALPGIRERAHEIAAEPLDHGLRRLLKAHGASERDTWMVSARYGWDGSESRTLQDIANDVSLSRERVRQIVKKYVDEIEQSYMPQIEKAAELVADSAPLPARSAGDKLVEHGLSKTPIDAHALLIAADIFGYEVGFEIDSGDGEEYVVALGAIASGPVFQVARKESGRTGASNVDEVCAELLEQGHDTVSENVSSLLHSSPKVEFLVDDWFWVPSIPVDRNRLRNVTRRMLSVTPRLDLATIRQGVRRRYRFMRIDLVPPMAVLEALFEAHPEFVVDDGVVESVTPLDYRHELGEVERTFVDVLREVPTGLLDRSELEEAVIGRGVNPSTFSVFSTYSPILDHPALNAWCLRGHATDPAQLEALRAAVASRPRRRRTLAYGWDEEGHLRLTVELGNVNGPVIGIPSDISRYVAGRRFAATTLEGMPAGTVVINEQGSSWGYGPFLRRKGAEVGDAMTLSFDLVAEDVTLSLGDDSALNEDDG